MGSRTPARQRPRKARRKALPAIVGGTALAFAVMPALSAHAAPAASTAAQLRTDQAGYLPGDTKIAYLMAGAALSGETYQVLNSAGAVVASGTVTTTSRGSWNKAYPKVYPIDFSSVTAAGTYHVAVTGAVKATSDSFRVEDAGSLYGSLVTAGVNFYQNQRDGSDVIPGALNRKPSHLNDAKATVYKDPKFQTGGSDVIVGSSLTKIGGPVDVSGGWFDAGDYLKFTFTASYGDDLLYSAARALGTSAPASLTAEARYGTSWLNKMWNPSTKTLYLQVGIGSGNETTFFGDHDLWRLPQSDDSNATSGDQYAAAHRPVFEAAAPGAKIDPDIVGRVAAAFAFAAQADAASDPSQAAAELGDATSLYAMANTNPSSNLGSALPSAYYPESIWHDAMELGATEIALAQQDLGDPSSAYTPYLTPGGDLGLGLRRRATPARTPSTSTTSAPSPTPTWSPRSPRPATPPASRSPRAALIANLKAQVASRRARPRLGHLPRGRQLRRLRRGLAHLRLHLHRGPLPEGQRRHRVRGLRRPSSATGCSATTPGLQLHGRRGHHLPRLHGLADPQPVRLAQRHRARRHRRRGQRPQRHRQLQRRPRRSPGRHEEVRDRLLHRLHRPQQPSTSTTCAPGRAVSPRST